MNEEQHLIQAIEDHRQQFEAAIQPHMDRLAQLRSLRTVPMYLPSTRMLSEHLQREGVL